MHGNLGGAAGQNQIQQPRRPCQGTWHPSTYKLARTAHDQRGQYTNISSPHFQNLEDSKTLKTSRASTCFPVKGNPFAQKIDDEST